MNANQKIAIRRTAMAAVVLLVSLGLQACGKGNAPEPQTLVTVQAEHPETGSISEHIIADATLSPLAQAAITPKITAPVKKFYVQRGSRVKAGELLAVLDNRDLKAQALDNQGLYIAAQATYAMQTQAQVPEAYKKAQLDVDQAKAQLDLQTQIVASRKKLLQEGAIPGREYDTSVAALAQAKTNYGVALNTLNSMQKISRQASLQAAKGTLESAKGKYLAAEAQVDYSEIRSPINGVVTDRPLFAGETASPGIPLITVMDTSALLAKVHLAQTVTQQLSVGDSASVYVPGVDIPVPATVSLISPALDPGSTTVEVWLRVENKAGKYKAGTPVRVSITGRTVSNAIKIPLSAVLTAQDGSKSVMVIGPDSTAKQIPVQPGINDSEEVQIISGIHPWEMVITTGAYGLDNGTKVKIGNPNTAGNPGDGK